MFNKIFKIILILQLFYQTSSFSKSTSFDNFNSKDLSNYFSGIVAFENKSNSKALKFFNSSKNLIKDHDPYLKKYVKTLVLENKVLEAIKPERFYLYLTTNGYYLDESMAKRLAEANVSRVSVSIDSMDEKIHDEIRGRKDSWRRAMEGLKHVQKAGIDPYLNITVGHYNAHTDHLKQLLKRKYYISFAIDLFEFFVNFRQKKIFSFVYEELKKSK